MTLAIFSDHAVDRARDVDRLEGPGRSPLPGRLVPDDRTGADQRSDDFHREERVSLDPGNHPSSDVRGGRTPQQMLEEHRAGAIGERMQA